MRWIALVLVAGCHTAPVTPDAESLEMCLAEVEGAIGRTCTTDADCVLLAHEDCCGLTELGIAVTSRGAAEVAEAHYDACLAQTCGARGCASATRAEDGQVPSGTQTIVAVCISHACTSVVQ